jgi:hypothetical protein
MSQQLDPAIFGDRPKNLCRIEGCTRKRHKNRTLCPAHFVRNQRGQPMDTPIREWTRRTEKVRRPCSVPGCWRAEHNHKRQLCKGHYRRFCAGQPLGGEITEYRPKGERIDMCARIPKDAAAVICERAKALGLTRAAMSRRILEDWAKGEQSRGAF